MLGTSRPAMSPQEMLALQKTLGNRAATAMQAPSRPETIGTVAQSQYEELEPETEMSFNLQYLHLQSQMQHENRIYTAITDIMKTKHDSVGDSISNVR